MPRLFTARGRYAPRLEVELAPLGAIDVMLEADAIPRAQPFTLLSVGLSRTVERHTWTSGFETNQPTTLRLEWLPPGKYDWQLGFDGHFGSGTVTVVGGQASMIEVEESRAVSEVPDVVRVEIDVSNAPGVDLSQAFGVAIPECLREAAVRAGVRLVGSTEEGDLALEVEDLGPGRWWVGVGTPSSFQILSQAVLIQDGVPVGSLRVVPNAQRMPLKIKLTPPKGLPLNCWSKVCYFDGPRAVSSILEAGDSIQIDVPSTRPTPLFAITEHYGPTLVVFDPSSGNAELEVPLLDNLNRSLIRVTDDDGQPLAGVSVDCGERRLGKTDALGHLWIDMMTAIDGLIRVGASNPELEQIFPMRRELELGVDVRSFPVGYGVMMRRRD